MARPSTSYEPRRPEGSVLHQIVQDHLESFLVQAARLRDGDGLPQFVERAFREFLQCGFLAGGFARFHCGDCSLDRLVPFSCKGRTLCPSWGVNLILYYGVLGARAAWRPEVVPRPTSGQDRATGDPVDEACMAATPDTARSRARRQCWAALMRRTFGFDVLSCPRCGGRLRLIALIEEAAVIGRILRHLGLPTGLPVPGPARAPPLLAATGEAQADEYESAP